MLLGVHARDDDVAALDVPHGRVGRHARHGFEHLRDPGSADVDNRLGANLLHVTRRVGQPRTPDAAVARRTVETRAGANFRALAARRHAGQHDQPRVVDACVGVDEAGAEPVLEAGTPATRAEVDGERPRQAHPPADAVVEEEPGTDHPRRAQVRLVRQHERQRLDQVRRLREQHLALGERLGDQPEFVVLEIAQSAVDQLGAPLRGCRGEIVLLDQQRREPAPGSVARHAGTVDATPDDQEIVDLLVRPAHWTRLRANALRGGFALGATFRALMRASLRRHDTARREFDPGGRSGAVASRGTPLQDVPQ